MAHDTMCAPPQTMAREANELLAMTVALLKTLQGEGT
jgi:hypothetical protein